MLENKYLKSLLSYRYVLINANYVLSSQLVLRLSPESIIHLLLLFEIFCNIHEDKRRECILDEKLFVRLSSGEISFC